MTTDKTPATLATAKHGGCVQLEDGLPPLPYPNYPVSKTGLQNNAYTASQMTDYARAALSAQPSPVGQGDARAQFETWAASRRYSILRHTHQPDQYMVEEVGYMWRAWQAALAARQPVRIYGCCAQPEGELHTAECPNMRHLAARQPVGESVCSGGFVIGNGSGEKYMAWGQVGPEWVADRSAALWLVRRADAEALAAENEDAWSILPVERCALPPRGWACTLADGHEGPCPTIAAPPAQAVGEPAQALALDLIDSVMTTGHRGNCRCWEYGADEDRCNCGLAETKEEARSLRALIDSQAVGNG